MILGVMSISTFTTLHVIISLIAVGSGLVVLAGMLGSRRLPGWTALFLVTTILTSATGFLFPITGFTPALATGIVSLIVLAVALMALYRRRLAGRWRWIYVAAAVAALWLNGFVLVVQAFEKLPLLNPHAPQVGPPFPDPQNTEFAIAQGVLLVLLLVLGVVAARKFNPAPTA
ncbi:MAG TPA: hypothetical protein VFW22_00170 [Pseudolabrys sp.]|nr:hypothetical protein [Pseudolabrys sp.]